MSLVRVCFLLAVFGAVGVLTVALRAEQTRSHARVEKLRLERVSLRRELWDVQLGIARLRSPDRIRDRVARWFPDTVDTQVVDSGMRSSE